MGFAAIALGAVLAASGAVPAPMVTPRFRHYDLDSGLPSDTVYSALEDARGYMWFGTHDGLVRFDGVHWEVFRHRPGDASSLAGNDVSELLQDRRGRLWVGGAGTGLARYVPGHGFRHWRHDSSDPGSLAGDDVWALAQTSDGSLWVGLHGSGLDRLRPGARHFEHLGYHKGDASGLGDATVTALKAGAGDRLWIGTWHGAELRRADGRLLPIQFPKGLAPTVWRINGEGSDVRLSTSAGLFRVDTELRARRVAPGRLPPIGVNSSLRSDDGGLWVTSSRHGVYRLDASGQVRHFGAQPLLPGGLPSRSFWKVSADREGGVWFASGDGGVAYLSPDWQRFSRFGHIPDDAGSLRMRRALSLSLARDGTLLVGGSGGRIDRLNPSNGMVTHLGHVGHETIYALAAASQGRIWVSAGDRVTLYDPAHGTQHQVAIPAPLQQHIAVDAAGDVYVATYGHGVWWASANGRKLRHIPAPDVGQTHGVVSQMGFFDGRLWRATEAGLTELNADGLRFAYVPGVPHKAFDAFDVHGDSLWLADDDGLYQYRRGADGYWRQARHVATGRQTLDSSVRVMVADDRGRLWLATEKGLWRYDIKNGSFREYGRKDGLAGVQFLSRAQARAPSGALYLGTPQGIVGFDPARVRDTRRRPMLRLESARVQRDGHDQALRPKDGRLAVGWDDRNLTVTVHAVSYIDPARNRYRFRLDGLDAGWVATGARGQRQFAALPAGHYRLQVQAAGPDGVWAPLAQPLTLDVSAPPWLRLWAFALYALMLAALVWLGAVLWRRRLEQRHRMQMAEQQRQLAERANAAKTHFLATLGHEIRTPMTGVLGMTELMLREPLSERQRRYATSIQRSGSLLLKLVNDALDLARIEAGRFVLEPRPFDPAALLREVGDLESGLAARKGLAMAVHVDGAVPACVLGDGERIRQVLINLTNNALKFTESGCVRLGLEAEGRGLCFSVTDTGPGMAEGSRERLFQRYEQEAGPQQRSGSGLGLAICRELVELMEGRIEVASTLGQGSRFDVWLPLAVVESGPSLTEPSPECMPSAELLLVEDDVTVAEVLKDLLGELGHRVTHVGHGLAALGECQAHRFDAVLLDLDLPGVDGFEVAGMLRRQPGGEEAIIIAVTARSGGDEQTRAQAAGMDGFLRKPLTLAQLEAELRRLLFPHVLT
ncbi:hybrid sensor histidine kinase/response regulator [Oleiagrimonas sp. C23AA]|uniref:hybrid sensor histidine kinase/response regulator n=1 Tax=Oleiagrimonas sp. C23AA TaxID=2719047 RepID=UPI00141F9682|nr:hybrid sensor histidine kinase/response regulator [Oleiagrimonas sp. C23AA]NII12083.1 response regulator [Oleiagrimonas sp. C23AA]